jgi:K+-transporting ATPase ATPase C chain
MWSQLSPGLRINIFFTLLLGVAYPLLVTGVCQVAFPHQANGSLITQGDRVIGSELIGQNFAKPEYFQPRPSAAGNDGYDATSSGASNYGPTNQDLVTASGSGLDPHVSPDSATAQASRVAKARGVPADQVNQLVSQLTEQPDFGVLGEPRVNVLKLNLALDQKFPRK